MGKAHTTTETMEHMSSVVNEVATNISSESNKLLKTINSIQEKTNQTIKRSDDLIEAWEGQISSLENEISSYQSMEDEDHSYRAQIAACQEEISEISARIRKERMRNNELRKTLSQFRQQSSQTLKTIKQTNLAAEGANTSGKQYLAKKTNIISAGYGKVVAGATALGVGLGLVSSGNDGGRGNASGGMKSASGNGSQGAFSVRNFGTDTSAAQSWGTQAFQGWNNSLSIVERQALIDYKKELYPHESSYYVNINNTLRGKDTFTNGNQMRYMRMHNALSRASVPSDVTAYRAISREAYENMIHNAQLAGSDGLRDNGFMSCSLVSDNLFTNNSDVIMRLTITEGSRGAYIGNVGSEFANECELLLDCGSTVFVTNTIEAPRSTITGYSGDTDMITIVEGVVES